LRLLADSVQPDAGHQWRRMASPARTGGALNVGAQQQRLGEELRKLGFSEVTKPPSPKLVAMPPTTREHVMELYQSLGGVHPDARLSTGPWDYAFEDNLVVELDESAHFNRYRATTLKPAWAQHLPWRSAYMAYAAEFEDVCLRDRGWGGYWTNTSTERQFGEPGTKGELDGAGSPRWKQRALYDAMRDITALHGGVRLVRLSVYDDVGGVLLGDTLKSRAPLDTDAFRALIAERTLDRRQ
jgi:hypothetical protein